MEAKVFNLQEDETYKGRGNRVRHMKAIAGKM